MKNPLSTNKYAQFFALYQQLRNIGMPSERDEIVFQFTSGRTTSLKDLSPQEYKELVHWMSQLYESKHVKYKEIEDRQRKKVIALFCQMGYTKGDKPDMERINTWCATYGPIKRYLNYHSGANLTKLVTQAEKVYNSFIERL